MNSWFSARAPSFADWFTLICSFNVSISCDRVDWFVFKTKFSVSKLEFVADNKLVFALLFSAKSFAILILFWAIFASLDLIFCSLS